MAQTGYTPIKIYSSSTASAVPSASNLDNTDGAELAINITDGKLFYKDNLGVVRTLANVNAAGDVAGPASATDNAITRFDGATGKLIQNSSATLDDTGAPTFTGSVNVAGTSASAADIKLYEDTDNGTNYVSLKAPAVVTSNLQLVLPGIDGINGQALVTDGAGNLSFTSITSGVSKGQSIAFAMLFGL